MISLKNVVQSYSGAIEFRDLSESAYLTLNKIVEMLNAGEDPQRVLTASAEAKTALASGDKVVEKSASIKPVGFPKVPNKRDHYSNMQGTVSKEKVFEIVKQIVENAKAHPDRYEFRYCKAGDFLKAYPDLLKGCGRIAVGAAMEKLGYFLQSIRPEGEQNYSHLINYPMPIENAVTVAEEEEPKDDEGKSEGVSFPTQNYKKTWKVDTPVDSYAKNWSAEQASILRKARLDADLSVTELSELIGYPFYAIQRWEAGSSSPSSEAMEVLKKSFGTEFSKSIDAASGKVTAVGA